MATRSLRLAGVVLAAGDGERFSSRPGAKLLADLDGRPLLEHTLMAVRDFGPEATVVVLGRGGDVERAMRWSGEERVVNPTPERGIGSSIVVGIHALEAHGEGYDGAFIVLGDQPRLRAETMRALERAAASARPADRPLVVPRYERSDEGDEGRGPRNPVLLLRPAWPLVHELDGDHGLASIIDRDPDLVLDVRVTGTMPDVDTRSDLERLSGLRG